MQKPSAEVKLISALIFLYPVFLVVQCLILTTEPPITFSKNEILHWGGAFIFYGILGYGVLRLNWKMRLAMIVFAAARIAGPLLGIILAPLVNLELFFKVLKMHGANVVIWGPLAIFLNTFFLSAVYLSFILYKLTRPRIKKQFQK